MSLSIAEVYSTTWTILKKRFWPLVGAWLVFFAIQIAASTLLSIIFGGAAFAFGFSFGTDLDPSSSVLGGLGIGLIILMTLFYLVYFAIIFAQQGAMTAIASPLESIAFGDALTVGFRTGITLLGFVFLAILGGLAVSTIFWLSAVLGEFVAAILAIILIPFTTYLFLRFAVLVPVIAVEKVFNPVKAARRTWSVTRGHALAILLLYLVLGVITLVVFGLPFALVMAPLSLGADAGASLAAAGSVILVVLLMIPLFIAYSVAAVALNAALHLTISDRKDVAAVFE